MIRVGVVGYGFGARSFHCYLVNRVPEMRVTAVVSPSEQRRGQAAAELGVKTYATVGEMLAGSELDLVVVSTPHDTHTSIVLEALNAGVPVVVDKAMALTTAEADRMIDAARAKNVMFSVFQNRRWDWDFLTVKQAVDGGLVGAPTLVESAIMRYSPPKGWRSKNEAGGGILYDWGAHLVDQALVLVPDKVESVTCDIQYRGWGSEIGSYARILLRFANEILFSIEISNLSMASKPRFFVVGEKGSLVKTGFDPQEHAMLAGDIDAAVEDSRDRAVLYSDLAGIRGETVLDTIHGNWTDYYRNIADALMGRAEPVVKPEESRRGVRILEAALESARDGKSVKVGV